MEIRKIIWKGGLLGGLLFTLNSCYYDEFIPVDPVFQDVGIVTFAVDIIPIFDSGCNLSGCHNAGGQTPNLTSASAYISLTNGGYINTANPENSELYQWMKGNKGTPMPVSGSNAIYNARVLAWIKQGAHNN